MDTSPHSPRHRGAHPEDKRLFAPGGLDDLRAATADLSYLLGRRYAMPSALKVVGDRYTLHERQRLAVSRAACSDDARERRLLKERPATEIAGQPLIVDGFNLLITLEAALSGGVVLACRDGCRRDIASVHGSYHSVDETTPALDLVAVACRELAPSTMVWVLDQPVSNSGRLAALIREYAATSSLEWTVEVAMSPDKVLRESADIAVTSDANILDNVRRWVNLGRFILERLEGELWLVDLSVI